MGENDLSVLKDSIARVLAAHCDRRAVHNFIDGKSDLDVSLWTKAAELGWLAVGLPEAYGGLGLGVQAWDTLHRELGRYLAPGSFLPTLAFAQWLIEVGGDDQKAEYLPQIACGELTVGVPLKILSRAPIKLRDGKLYGRVDLLGSSTDGLAVVSAGSTDRIECWALISPENPQASLERLSSWDRTRPVFSLTCDGVAPMGLIADPEGKVTSKLARHMALATASDSLGGAAAIAYQTVEYLKGRIQFDKPVGSNQALKHRCVDMISAIATNEHLLAQAVECAASGDEDTDMWAALAKAGGCETYAFVAADCVQLHGGVGHTWEFDVHLFVKRARLNEVVVANSSLLRDFAAQTLAVATRAGRITTELGL